MARAKPALEPRLVRHAARLGAAARPAAWGAGRRPQRQRSQQRGVPGTGTQGGTMVCSGGFVCVRTVSGGTLMIEGESTVGGLVSIGAGDGGAMVRLPIPTASFSCVLTIAALTAGGASLI